MLVLFVNFVCFYRSILWLFVCFSYCLFFLLVLYFWLLVLMRCRLLLWLILLCWFRLLLRNLRKILGIGWLLFMVLLVSFICRLRMVCCFRFFFLLMIVFWWNWSRKVRLCLVCVLFMLLVFWYFGCLRLVMLMLRVRCWRVVVLGICLLLIWRLCFMVLLLFRWWISLVLLLCLGWSWWKVRILVRFISLFLVVMLNWVLLFCCRFIRMVKL